MNSGKLVTYYLCTADHLGGNGILVAYGTWQSFHNLAECLKVFVIPKQIWHGLCENVSVGQAYYRSISYWDMKVVSVWNVHLLPSLVPALIRWLDICEHVTPNSNKTGHVVIESVIRRLHHSLKRIHHSVDYNNCVWYSINCNLTNVKYYRQFGC